MAHSKKIANGILVMSAATAAGCASFLDHPVGKWGFVASEAVFVASFADWFAVSALFRKPLRVPFGTDVIRSQHGSIGDGLSSFVNKQLLSKSEISRMVDGFDFAAAFVSHVDGEGRSALVEKLVDILQSTMAAPGDKAITAIHDVLKSAASNVRLAPYLAGYLEDWREASLSSSDLKWVANMLRSNQSNLKQGLGDAIDDAYDDTLWPWLVEKALPKAKLKKIIWDSFEGVLGSDDFEDTLKSIVDGIVQRLIADLKDRRTVLAKSVEEIKDIVFDKIDLKQELRILLKRAANGSTKEEMRGRVDGILIALSAKLGDKRNSVKINDILRNLLKDNTELLHAAIDSLIAHVFKNQLSADELVRFIEANLGEQLHGIRVRGAVVGLMVGVLLGAITSLTL